MKIGDLGGAEGGGGVNGGRGLPIGGGQGGGRAEKGLRMSTTSVPRVGNGVRTWVSPTMEMKLLTTVAVSGREAVLKERKPRERRLRASSPTRKARPVALVAPPGWWPCPTRAPDRRERLPREGYQADFVGAHITVDTLGPGDIALVDAGAGGVVSTRVESGAAGSERHGLGEAAVVLQRAELGIARDDVGAGSAGGQPVWIMLSTMVGLLLIRPISEPRPRYRPRRRCCKWPGWCRSGYRGRRRTRRCCR